MHLGGLIQRTKNEQQICHVSHLEFEVVLRLNETFQVIHFYPENVNGRQTGS